MTRNGDIRSLSGTEGIWGAGVKWEARDASARLEPLGIVTIFLLFHLHMSSSRRTVTSPPLHFIVSIDSAVCFTSTLFTFTCLLLAFRRMYFIHVAYMFSFTYLLHAMQAWPICI